MCLPAAKRLRKSVCPSTIALEELREEPYASIICYPEPDKTALRRRIQELGRLGVTALEFAGEKRVLNLHVLGKGCVGIVAAAYRRSERVALKIRRTDADRSRMQHEADMLKKANSVQVGPRLLGVSNNFLLMQLVEGPLLIRWLEERRSKRLLTRVLGQILEQCWHLDTAGLDHGELSHAPKHVIVDKTNKPFIVDFETASLDRRPSNVTSICQFLFFGSSAAQRLARKLGQKDRRTVFDALRTYKNSRSRPNFDKVLEACGL